VATVLSQETVALHITERSTTLQTDLDWTERADVLREAREKTIDERFTEFHAANPAVYLELRDLAMEARQRGCQKLGIRMLWEAMRWSRLLRTAPNVEGDFRLNDHFPSRYVRLLLENEPELRGMFELRGLRK
jgi:hypothetical protein